MAIPQLEEAARTAGRSDAELWNYLGLAYLKKNESKKGRESLETAVALEPANHTYRTFLAYAYFLNKDETKARREIEQVLSAERKNAWAFYVRAKINIGSAQFDKAIDDANRISALDQNNPLAFTIKADANFGKFVERLKKGRRFADERELLQRAGDDLRRCLRECPNNAEAAAQQDKLEVIEAFEDAANRLDKNDLGSESTDAGLSSTKPKILSKPRSTYTDEARKNMISGEIRILVLLGKDGRVLYAVPIKRLGFGLDEESVNAAYRIKFTPATKDGRAVPYAVVISYGFSIS